MGSGVTILVAIMVLAAAGTVLILRFMIKRAIHSVIRIFRQHNAVTIRDAKTMEELGLNPKPFLERALRLRDYKPYALQILRNANVIQQTEDGRLYLDEGQLGSSRWGNAKI